MKTMMFALLALAASAQRGSFKTPPIPVIAVQPVNNTLHIHILPPVSWSLATDVGPVTSVRVMDVAVERDARGASHPHAIDPVLTTSSPGEIKIVGVQYGAIAIAITAPAFTTIQVTVTGNDVFTGRVGPGLLVKNGTVIPGSGSNPAYSRALVAQFTQPESPQLEIVLNAARNHAFVQPHTLKSHFQQATRPSAVPASADGLAIGTIAIRADGTVDHIQWNTALSTPGLSAFVDKVIPSWRFTPFIVDGKPITVESEIAVVFQHGIASSPLW